MSEKYFSETEGFTDNFIEVSDSWTMKEVRELTDGDENEYFRFFRSKVTSMLLRDETGKEFTNPKEITKEDLDEFNISLIGFFGSSLSLHVRRRKALGGANVRTSSLGTDTAQQAKKK